TWLPLFDSTTDNAALMYGGWIAVAPTNPNIVYFATGESNGFPNGQPFTGQQDNFAGSGVYKSTDAGASWTLLTGAAGNPIAGQAVTKMVVDTANPNRIFVSTSTRTGQVLNGTATAAGIWRHDGTNWVNMIATPSATRAGTVGQAPFDMAPPNTPGPNDDYRIVFPQTNATWSDLLLIGGTLYVALGESNQTSGTTNVVRNAVYRTSDLGLNNPNWFIGSGGVDTRPGGFPSGDIASGPPRNGYIKLAGSGTTIYASVVRPDTDALRGELLDIQKSTDGGQTWAATAAVPTAPFGSATTTGNPPTNATPALGRYDNALIAQDNNTVYLAGLNDIFRTTDGGANWGAIPAGTTGIKPAAQFHSLYLDSGFRLLSGSDGGVWRWDGTEFRNLNGNLSVTQLNSADPHPTDLGQALAGSQDNGPQQFNASSATNKPPIWARVDDTAGTNAGVIRYDPINPLVAYEVRNGALRKTTNGGTSWTTLRTVSTNTNYFPLVVDSINSQRILIGGGGGLLESLTGANPSTNLGAGINPTAIAIAAFQGPFQADPGFTTVTDKLSNTYDPDTIYVSDGAQLRVTKNHGVSWVTRTPAGAAGGTITDIAVDPSNRDTVLVTVSRASGVAGGRVFRSTNAGQTWTDITGNLPTIATWRVIIDPRSGTAYLGNDNGVWQLPSATTTGTFTWTRVGAGMPRVAVKDLVLNQTLNTLTAASYGRGMFQLFLTDYAANSGGLRAVSGASTWTGPVTFTGPTTINVSGTQQIQNGIAAASLNIIGSISDATPTGNFTLTKVGLGTLTLSGVNTYGGQTLVQQGVLQSNSPRALGTRSEVQTVTVTGSTTGTFTLTFNGQTTNPIAAVAAASMVQNELNALSSIGGVGGSVSVTQSGSPGNLTYTITFGGKLVIGDQNEMTASGSGGTNAAVTTIQNGSLDTIVTSGAALELRSDLELEPVTINGDGFQFNQHFTGALRNVANANVYTGTLTLGTNTTIGADSGTTLTIGSKAGLLGTGTVTDGANSFSINKELPGTLALASANTYDGLTRVFAGALRVEDALALGTPGNGTVVTDGAQLQIARNSATLLETTVTSEPLSLSGTGIFGTGALLNVRADTSPAGTNNNAWQGPINFTITPGFAPATNPGSQIAIGSSDARDTLTIDTAIAQNSALASFGLIKVGPGRVALTKANAYTGVTNVNAGTLRVLDNGALGPVVSSEVQTVTLVGPTGPTTFNFQLSFNGATTGALASNITSTALQTALGNLATIGAPGGVPNVLVSDTPGVNGRTFTITFQGALANTDVPQITATGVPAGAAVNITTAQPGGLGTVVATGAGLELDGSLGALSVPERLRLNGDGVNSAGALNNVAGNNTYSGPVTLLTNTSLGAVAGTQMSVSTV
ncbi:MAG TPA: autotransporter-associated beta strand repeat-containing protein, partial [Gemmataceae bacterium]|nr:autotransporter-associated beta strand repeat-containing protein [Gemmataceae bacterium]